MDEQMNEQPSEVGTSIIPPPPPGPPMAPPARNRRWMPIVGMAVAVSVGASVAIVALSGEDSRTASPPATSPSAPTPTLSPPTVLPPVGLDAKAKPFAVSLTWSYLMGGDAVEEYRLYRDDRLVASGRGDAKQAVDDTALPGHSYFYQLEAHGVNGGISARATIHVKTPVPALSAARVEGPFSLTLKPGSSYGYSDLARKQNLEWGFKPKCKAGACDVVVTDPRGGRFVLRRQGGAYKGSASVTFLASCGETAATSTLTVELRVTGAEAIDGEWQATIVKGTMANREPAQHGCAPSGRTYSLSGKRL
jgi:hypothetical protein